MSPRKPRPPVLLSTEEAWAHVFGAWRASSSFDTMTPSQASFIAGEIDALSEPPVAAAALERFEINPSLAAVEVLDKLLDSDATPAGCDRILALATARSALGRHVPELRSTVLDARANIGMLDASLERVSREQGIAATPEMRRAEIQSVWNELRPGLFAIVDQYLRVTTEVATNGIDITPRETMAWLVRQTQEGKDLVAFLRSCQSFEDSVGTPDAMQQLWDQLEPGVAGVLMRAVEPPTPPQAKSAPEQTL